MDFENEQDRSEMQDQQDQQAQSSAAEKADQQSALEKTEKSLLQNLKQDFKKTFGLRGTKPVTVAQKRKAYEIAPSIAEYLPWMEYDAANQCFFLQDGLSVAALFELTDVPCDASPESYLAELCTRFQSLLQHSVPLETDSPWHLQFYCQDELNLEAHLASVKAAVKPLAEGTVFTQEFLKLYEEHCQLVTRPKGLFKDHQVTDSIFRGKQRKIRLVIYRLMTEKTKLRRGQDVIKNLNQVARRIQSKLASAGVVIKRCGGAEFYAWMLRWFNPVSCFSDENGRDLLAKKPYPSDDQMPFGYDFVEQLFYRPPKSDHAEGLWYFEGQPHALLTVQGLSVVPRLGHLTAERAQSKKQRYSVFDQLPIGSIFVMNIVITDQSDVKLHLRKIEKSCAGDNAESNTARLQCEEARFAMDAGNYLFPVAMGFYIKGEDENQLADVAQTVENLLTNHGLSLLAPEVELAPCDAYLRFLPMAFDYALDQSQGIRRCRYLFASQIASLLPLYGRYRGSGNPGFLRFNRGGEPFCFDPFVKSDKSTNSHMLYLAETGGGKSASLVFDLMSFVALYNPRVFILEAGDSFKLFCDYAKKFGKTVHQVKLSTKSPTPLNPFADALKLLEPTAVAEAMNLEKTADALEKLIGGLADNHRDSDEADDEERDILGEMALAVELMITGGDVKEAEQFTRANRSMVLEALMHAAKAVKTAGRDEVIAEDVMQALSDMAKALSQSTTEQNPQKVARLQEMADSMKTFTHDPFTASFFNRPGKPWPRVDITRLDMGMMKKEQYGAQLSLAVMGMLTQIVQASEHREYEERMTIVLIDESHILTKNPLTSASITQFSKMSRKLGMWLWLATQNMADFPDESRKMLSMIAFWIGLGTSEAEIDEMKRFKQMTDEEKSLFLSVHKEIPHYVEGVVMSRRIQGLFRNVPPRLALTLGMTEKDEKAERFALMQAHGVDELGAAEMMAEAMKDRLREAVVE